jgi:hypothetical protein
VSSSSHCDHSDASEVAPPPAFFFFAIPRAP